MALVIGNGAYSHGPSLRNPANDAHDVADALRRVGFEVIEGLDLDIDSMLDKVEEFEQRLVGARVALAYYAGHGVAVDGVNYLVPIDAQPDTRFALQRETISADVLLGQVMERSGRISILILDACRSSAFASRFTSDTRSLRAGSGLAEVEPVSGSLVAYAAAPGRLALDGDGPNSPFTAALLRHLPTPGLEIENLLKKVRLDVAEETSRRQEPWAISRLDGDFYFSREPIETPTADLSLPSSFGYGGRDMRAFELIRDTKSASFFSVFLNQYNKSELRAFAAARLVELTKEAQAADPMLPEERNVLGQKGNPALPQDSVQIDLSSYTNDDKHSPSQVERTLGLTQADWRHLVLALKTAGFNPGDPEVAPTIRTRTALAAWQKEHFGEATGFLNDTERKMLLEDAEAQFYIGWAYTEGAGIPSDEREALRWYALAAEQGNPKGMVNTGWMYEHGKGVAQDDGEAVRWYRKAALLGSASGMVRLGWMYEDGRGVAKDTTEAMIWFRRAAGQGDTLGQRQLGRIFYNGTGVPSDHTEAVRWFRAAAEQADAEGQVQLGRMYWAGEGVAKDMAEGIAWYSKAADQGNTDAMLLLGAAYMGIEGVQKNMIDSIHWLRLASDEGNAEAQLLLGTIYYEGKLIKKNIKTGLEWIKKSAEQGLDLGMLQLAGLFAAGRDVPRDQALAVRWYRAAAEQGNSTGQAELGVRYKLGEGVPQDDVAAVRWFRQAAYQGNSEAQSELGSMYQDGRGVPKDDARAARWYRKAAEQGDAVAQNELGVMYENGLGLGKSSSDALYWYRLAAKQGNTIAKANLIRIQGSDIPAAAQQ